MAGESKRALSYETGTPHATRGQIRLVLLFLLIQVVMTAQSNYAPWVMEWAQARWAEHKQGVAHRRTVRQNHVAMQQRLTYSGPVDQVVWDEIPDTAAKLLGGSGYSTIEASGEPTFLRQYFATGARANAPAFFPDSAQSLLLARGNGTLVFLHGRQAAGGPERLVVVCVGATLQTVIPLGSPNRLPTESFAVDLYKMQTFSAQSLVISPDEEPQQDGRGPTELSLEEGDSGVDIAARWEAAKDPSQPGNLRIKLRNQLRVYAGQADPSDASHFTISYELDGIPGVIDGWLRSDGKVALEPRVGKRIGTVWFPHAK